MPKDALEKILSMEKFINQLYFMALNIFGKTNFGKTIINTPLSSPVLKRAVGKYIPWSECKTKECKEKYNPDPSVILVQRSSKNGGFICQGDSGGPSVVEHEGSFILVGIAFMVMYKRDVWPETCHCCDNREYQMDANVSFVLPWIQ